MWLEKKSLTKGLTINIKLISYLLLEKVPSDPEKWTKKGALDAFLRSHIQNTMGNLLFLQFSAKLDFSANFFFLVLTELLTISGLKA